MDIVQFGLKLFVADSNVQSTYQGHEIGLWFTHWDNKDLKNSNTAKNHFFIVIVYFIVNKFTF